MGKILVTGGNGQLGKCIKKTLKPLANIGLYNEYVFTGHEVDITDKEQIRDYIVKNKFNAVVNCAAYTNVAKAEEDRDNAFKVNYDGVKNLGEICSENDIFLITIGTDYVYGDKHNSPIEEGTQFCPLNVYGQSKAQGIYELSDIVGLRGITLMTSWLYSEFEGNFVSKMYDKLQKEGVNKVVNDQTGSPTYAMDLARFIVKILEEKWYESMGVQYYYNFTNEGTATWYDLAKAIEEYGNTMGKVVPCSTSDFPSNVVRPPYSVLSTKSIKKDFPDFHIPYWRESLRYCIEEIRKKQ